MSGSFRFDPQSNDVPDQKNSRLLFHPSFDNTIAELKKRKIRLPGNPSDHEMDFGAYSNSRTGKIVESIGDLEKFKLDPKKGQQLCNSALLCAYDESVNKFEGLEGTAYLTSHSLIIHGSTDFIPINLLTFYFYTRSLILTKGSKYIKQSEDAEVDSKRDYIVDRKRLLVENVPENSILFIDGPIIGGNMATATIDMNKELSARSIVPICFVKNSNSNMVTDNIDPLKGNYNSDMHWAYSYLKAGERTGLFRYVDAINPSLTKIFCYLKAFDVSPSRIELDMNTYRKYSDNLHDFLNLAYFLLLTQGDLRNPQIRSIAVAEKYARATLKLVNFTQMMRDIGITPTMNQERFAW